MKILIPFAIGLLIIVSADKVNLVDEEPKAEEFADKILDWQHPFHYTSPHADLLVGVEHAHPHPFDTVTQTKIAQIKNRMNELIGHLMREEARLIKLKEEVAAPKKDFFWFFNRATRLKVDEAQLAVNDQQRVVDNLVDDITIQWKHLKPLYGIYSKLFLSEALGFIPQIWKVGMDVLTTLLELGLLSLLFFWNCDRLCIVSIRFLGILLLPSCDMRCNFGSEYLLDLQASIYYD